MKRYEIKVTDKEDAIVRQVAKLRGADSVHNLFRVLVGLPAVSRGAPRRKDTVATKKALDKDTGIAL